GHPGDFPPDRRIGHPLIDICRCCRNGACTRRARERGGGALHCRSTDGQAAHDGAVHRSPPRPVNDLLARLWPLLRRAIVGLAVAAAGCASLPPAEPLPPELAIAPTDRTELGRVAGLFNGAPGDPSAVR